MKRKFNSCCAHQTYSMKIAVIGLGEIGGAVFDEIAQHPKAVGLDLVGNDLDPEKLKPHDHHHHANTTFSSSIPIADLYIVCVWSTDQILNVISQIDALNPKALICIESTIDPTAVTTLRRDNVVAFPHRFNPNDPEHKIFNLDRLIGGHSPKAVAKVIKFLTKFMKRKLIHRVSFEIAVLSKVAENAYRALEIIMAQEIKKSCDANGVNFEELRQAMNTKWNIQMHEARAGVSGKCLPKDLALFNKMFPDFKFGQFCWELNEEYKKLHNKPL